jgi:peptidoglycan hydrolase-like protein with peptidoglycan-binding domain
LFKINYQKKANAQHSPFWYNKHTMKMFLNTTIIILFVVALALVPQTFAQSQEELGLQAQYDSLVLQVIAALQARISDLQGGGSISLSDAVIPSNHLCAVSYTGNSALISVQQELQNQGFTITKIDGRYGPETEAATKAFQTSVGAAKNDGIIGNETRTLLSRASVVCKGDQGAVVSDQPASLLPIPSSVCNLGYYGFDDVKMVQQELQDQGYAITKIDGKIGSETTDSVSAFQSANNLEVDGVISEAVTIALSRASVSCDDIPESTNIGTVVINSTPDSTLTLPPVATNFGTVTLEKTNIIAGVRTTTAGIPDDTAVFTYFLTFKNTGIIYILNNPDGAFEIDTVSSSEVRSNAEGVKSVISSAQKVLRADGVSYFRVQDDDTMSLRTSVQPGAGNYFGELSRLSYTLDDAITVVNPAMINYRFDSATWRSEQVTLLN